MKKSKEKTGFAVFVVSLKKSKYFFKKRIESDPDYPNLLVVVRKRSDYEGAIKESKYKHPKILGMKYPKRYKGIVESYGVTFHTEKLDAYKRAFQFLQEMRDKNLKARVYGSPENPDYSVYAFKLNAKVLKDKIFNNHNPALDKGNEPACYYVGQTNKEIEQRFKDHQDEKAKGSTRWGKKFFVTNFEEAYDSKLLEAFQLETKKSTTTLTHFESLVIEDELTKWIRAKGKGAYSA